MEYVPYHYKITNKNKKFFQNLIYLQNKRLKTKDICMYKCDSTFHSDVYFVFINQSSSTFLFFLYFYFLIRNS